jgi:hypothetical protein
MDNYNIKLKDLAMKRDESSPHAVPRFKLNKLLTSQSLIVTKRKMNKDSLTPITSPLDFP